jgi:hypothetical protein
MDLNANAMAWRFGDATPAAPWSIDGIDERRLKQVGAGQDLCWSIALLALVARFRRLGLLAIGHIPCSWLDQHRRIGGRRMSCSFTVLSSQEDRHADDRDWQFARHACRRLRGHG